jgi:hypothetical protein
VTFESRIENLGADAKRRVFALILGISFLALVVQIALILRVGASPLRVVLAVGGFAVGCVFLLGLASLDRRGASARLPWGVISTVSTVAVAGLIPFAALGGRTGLVTVESFAAGLLACAIGKMLLGRVSRDQ